MKKPMLILLIIAFPALLQAQTLVKNSVDEFTDNMVRQTSFEPFTKNYPGEKLTTYVSILNIDNNIALQMKVVIAGASVFSIMEGQELIFKMDNGEIVPLKCMQTEISCEGCGANNRISSGLWGVTVGYNLSPEDIEILSNQSPDKIRLHINGGFFESEIRDKYKDVLKNALNLVI